MYPDFIPNNGTFCVSCQYPCMTCNFSFNVPSCIICELGFTLDANSTCIPTTCYNTLYCVVCQADGTCLQCLPGYYWSNSTNSCLPGVLGCLSAKADTPYVCVNCIEGTFLNPLTSYCDPCPMHCEKCSLYGTCDECYFGYQLSGMESMVCAPLC